MKTQRKGDKGTKAMTYAGGSVWTETALYGDA